MPSLTLVLGGTRSGKSAIAERLVSGDVLYLATCVPGDEELRERVSRHRARRSAGWTTIEAPLDPLAALALERVPERAPVLLECLSFLLFNWIESGASDAEVETRIEALLAGIRASGREWVIVSNDVSGALIPPDPAARRYQDLLGRANQRAAAAADRVILAVAGLAMTVK